MDLSTKTIKKIFLVPIFFSPHFFPLFFLHHSHPKIFDEGNHLFLYVSNVVLDILQMFVSLLHRDIWADKEEIYLFIRNIIQLSSYLPLLGLAISFFGLFVILYEVCTLAIAWVAYTNLKNLSLLTVLMSFLITIVIKMIRGNRELLSIVPRVD